MDKAVQYVVYRFKRGERVDFSDATHIYNITREARVLLTGNQKGDVFYVTALDRLQNESKAVKMKL
jgi:hypothetical protein